MRYFPLLDAKIGSVATNRVEIGPILGHGELSVLVDATGPYSVSVDRGSRPAGRPGEHDRNCCVAAKCDVDGPPVVVAKTRKSRTLEQCVWVIAAAETECITGLSVEFSE